MFHGDVDNALDERVWQQLYELVCHPIRRRHGVSSFIKVFPSMVYTL